MSPATATQPLQREQELASIIAAYNEVTEQLRLSHEQLEYQVRRLRDELADKNRELARKERLAALGQMAGLLHGGGRLPIAHSDALEQHRVIAVRQERDGSSDPPLIDLGRELLAYRLEALSRKRGYCGSGSSGCFRGRGRTGPQGDQ